MAPRPGKTAVAEPAEREYQVARGRTVSVRNVDYVHPAKVTLPRAEGDSLVKDGFLTNPRAEAEIEDAGENVGLEGKKAGPAVVQGEKIPEPGDDE